MFAAAHMEERHKTFMKGPDFSQIREKTLKRHEERRKAHRQDQSLKRRYQSSPSEPSLEDFPAILRSIEKAGDADLLAAAAAIRKILANTYNPPIQQVVDLGLLPALLTWMQRTDLPKLQYEACWAVINLASGTHDHVVALVSKGVIPIAYTLLKSEREKVREHAVWLIGNLAGDSAQIRDALLQSQCLPNLLTCIQQSSPGALTDSYSWAVSNLCRGKPKAAFQHVSCAVPYLCSILRTQERTDILQDVLWALSHICGERNERVQMLLDEGVLEKIKDLVRITDERIQFPALRIIGNIASGRENQTATILDLVPFLRSLLYSPNASLQKEVSWIFSNVASGPPSHLSTLVSSDVFAALVDVLPAASEVVQKEILFALSNASLAEGEEVAVHLVHIGVFVALSHILEQGGPNLIYAGLDVIRALLDAGQRRLNTEGVNEFCEVLEASGGLDQLENLQFHGNQQIYEKSMRTLKQYFEDREEMDSFLQGVMAGCKLEV